MGYSNHQRQLDFVVEECQVRKIEEESLVEIPALEPMYSAVI